MIHCSQLHKSVIELGLIQHSAQTDNMLRINSHIIHVSLLQTSVCWQEKEGFDVGPLSFLDKNGESETLPSLSGESGWSKKMWHFLLISHSLNGVSYCCQHMHYLPPHIPSLTHTHTHTHTHKQAHTLGGLHCWEINQNHVKSYSTIWCWSTTVCVRKPRTAANQIWALTKLPLKQFHAIPNAFSLFH